MPYTHYITLMFEIIQRRVKNCLDIHLDFLTQIGLKLYGLRRNSTMLYILFEQSKLIKHKLLANIRTQRLLPLVPPSAGTGHHIKYLVLCFILSHLSLMYIFKNIVCVTECFSRCHMGCTLE